MKSNPGNIAYHFFLLAACLTHASRTGSGVSSGGRAEEQKEESARGVTKKLPVSLGGPEMPDLSIYPVNYWELM
ncbi:hypothetical protein HN873_034114 [Arachis hypogaea]